MRAAFYTQQGGAREVLQTGELPTPEPGPGEVRVRMRTSGVNPSDWKSRRGGAGSVAHYAIQVAKLRGARVITTISSDVKAAHARAAGADETINYRTEDVGERVKALTDGRGVDVLIETDLSANAKLYPAVLRPHSTIVVYGTSASETALPGHWLLVNSIALRFFLIYELSAADRAAGIGELTELLERGRLIHTVARRLPLEAIAEAHEIVERGEVMGNVIADIP